MSEERCCNLCYTKCKEYKSLKTDLNEHNETYIITVKYFDPILLTQNESIDFHHNSLLCQDCWFHINEFHEFQERVWKTRTIWENNTELRTLLIEVKQEETQENVLNSNITYNGSLDQDENYLMGCNLEYGSPASCKDAVELMRMQTNTKDEENIFDLDDDMNEKIYNASNEEKSPQMARSLNKVTNLSEKVKTPILIADTKAKVSRRFNMRTARESDAIIAEWKPELICDLCNERVANFDKMRCHFKEKHKARFYVKCCERKFYRRCVLVNHVQLHLNPDAHKCDICGKSSTTKEGLKIHKKVVHIDTKQLKCNICEKLFKQKVTLDRHMLTHSTSSKDFFCSECGKGYLTPKLLKIHVKHVHMADRVCDQCGKTIHGSYAYRKHVMEHSGIERRTFPCDVCGAELKTATNLKRHKGIYHNDGSSIYVCSVCGKVAPSENALLNHKKLVHLAESKHICKYCNKAFKRINSLREHIAIHTGEDLYQCPHCPRKFKVSANMHHHRKRKHPVEWEETRKNRPKFPKINNNTIKKQIVIC